MTCGCGLLVSPRRAFAIVLGAALVAAPRLVHCAASWHGDGGLRVGDRVEALRWQGATIVEDLGGGRFVVDWDDGHGSQRARGPSQLRAAPAEPPAAGDRVEALFDEDGKWYPATVARELEAGRFQIDWDDDDERERVKDSQDLRTMRALEEKREWFADSSRLRADVPEGVGFYSAPDLGSAIAGRVLGWGESVEGTAVRSWLRVDGAFLPLRIGEVPVLRPAGAPAEPPRGRQTGRADPDPVVARLAAWLEDECSATGTARLFVGLFDKAGHPVRGIGAAQDVPRDEYVICVPRRCAISPDDAQNFLLPSDVDTASCDSLSRLAFWMALEQEKGDASEWAPHFAAMPTEAEYKTYHPAYLDDMSLAPEVDVWQWWLDALKQCHGGRAVPTYEAMKLQYVRLITRQFEEVGLVPLADMPNTGPPGQNNVQQTYNDEGHFCLSAKRDLWAGEEVLVDYGGSHHSPLMMLLLYGFALPRQYHTSTSTLSADECEGLRGLGARLPPNASRALRSFARFAGGFCDGAGPAVAAEGGGGSAVGGGGGGEAAGAAAAHGAGGEGGGVGARRTEL